MTGAMTQGFCLSDHVPPVLALPRVAERDDVNRFTIPFRQRVSFVGERLITADGQHLDVDERGGGQRAVHVAGDR